MSVYHWLAPSILSGFPSQSAGIHLSGVVTVISVLLKNTVQCLFKSLYFVMTTCLWISGFCVGTLNRNSLHDELRRNSKTKTTDILFPVWHQLLKYMFELMARNFLFKWHFHLWNCNIFRKWSFIFTSTWVNPLSPRSDQHLISPYSNTNESFIKIVRIKEMIANPRSFDHLTNSPFQYRRIDR